MSTDDGRRAFLLEKELLSKLQQTLACFQNSSKIDASFGAAQLAGLRYTSPFGATTSSDTQPFLPSDHVSSKQGTGLVHLAPALGHDDFKIGLKYSIENRCVIDAQGKYTDDDPALVRLGLTSLKVLDDSTTNKIKV